MDALVGDGLDLTQPIEPHTGDDPMQRRRMESGVLLRPVDMALSRPAVLKHCLEHLGLPVGARLTGSPDLRTLLSEAGRQMLNYYPLVPCSAYLESLHVLLAAGADPNRKDHKGRPPLEDTLQVLGMLSRIDGYPSKERAALTAGLASLIRALLPVTTHWPLYNGLPPEGLVKVCIEGIIQDYYGVIISFNVGVIGFKSYACCGARRGFVCVPSRPGCYANPDSPRVSAPCRSSGPHTAPTLTPR